MSIKNPGSAIGEGIGNCLEIASNNFIREIITYENFFLVEKGPINQKTGKPKKLLLKDQHGNSYNIDAVITDKECKPIILLEYKYIRYKKHNRDKGSWLCTAHSGIRKNYPSIRSSIAILAGNWSESSLKMIKSHQINVFLIPFETVSKILKTKGIVFDWEEKERNIAIRAWQQFSQLSEDDKTQIGNEMIKSIKKPLEEKIRSILNEKTEREFTKMIIEVHTNLGEVKTIEINNPLKLQKILKDSDLEYTFIFKRKDSPSIC
ncbi:MAG: hypothetical protein D6707_00155 [Bacteroidetes bacterium]|nr:MAG: hypothetical protein D6707_00155 [Bacteroidota bacterium]